MEYDVLHAPNMGRTGPPFIYRRAASTEAAPATFQETKDDDGETYLRRVSPLTITEPPSYYVVRREDVNVAFEIYAGPFDELTAYEIGIALSAFTNLDEAVKITRSRFQASE